jgi:Terminase large subunit, T4likevirus-type, N-terminal
MTDTSTPTFTEFDPKIIPFQYRLIYDIRKRFDYSLGTHEIMASGSIGSSKSLAAAHIAISHCILNPNARVLLGRRTLPSLKDTLIRKCIDHIGNDFTYWKNNNRGTIWFSNGSVLVPYSWADGNYKKVRSEEFSAAIIEELTENDDQEFYNEIRMRVGRLSHVKEKFILTLTNPDDPSHWAYKYFIQRHQTIHSCHLPM